MVTIYRDYDEEPDPVFLPLPEELGRSLYDLEMAAFSEDLPFYAEFLPAAGPVVELGCGSGRVSRHVATAQRPVVGVDISMEMLTAAAAHGHPHCSFCLMDMAALGFRRRFAAALVAYNTLNLLTRPAAIAACLGGIAALLPQGGLLLVQLFIPSSAMRGAHATNFQFQIFPLPSGGRVIKEIRTTLDGTAGTLLLDERFRLRPVGDGAVNKDYRQQRTIAAIDLAEWLQLFARAGFTPQVVRGDAAGGNYDPATSTQCFLLLQKNV